MTKILFVCHGKPRWQTNIFRSNAAYCGKSLQDKNLITTILLPFYYLFFSVQKHTVHNAVKRGKSWHFMPMLLKIFVCYPVMCRVRMVKTDRDVQKSVSLLSGYV